FTEALEGELQGRQVGTAAVDDDRVHYNIPLTMKSRSLQSRPLQHPLGGGQLVAFATQGLAQCTADAFEASLDHVMRVLARDAHVDRGSKGFGEGMEEMGHQLGWQPTDLLAAKTAFKHRKCAPGQIDRDLCLRLIHGQQKAVTRDSHFRTQSLAQSLAEGKRTILDGVVLVDLQIAPAGQLERKAAVFAQLLEHVIEEPDTGGDLDWRGLVETDADRNVGLPRASLDSGVPRCQYPEDLRPG